ncbi:MAG: hypothetical protein ACK50G_03870, partial [bacterium]
PLDTQPTQRMASEAKTLPKAPSIGLRGGRRCRPLASWIMLSARSIGGGVAVMARSSIRRPCGTQAHGNLN